MALKKIYEAAVHDRDNSFKKNDKAVIQDSDIILVVAYVAKTY